MVKLGRKQFLGWALESTAGTAVAVGNSNFHLVEDVSVEFSGDEHERVGNMGALDQIASVTGSVTSTISFTTELKGAGADSEPIDFPLWKACGMKTDESAYDYTLDQDPSPGGNAKTVSIRYFDGVQWDFKGCVGTAVITMESGSIAKIAWTFTGMCDGMPSDGTNPTVTYSTVVPPVCQNTTMTLDAGTAFGVCSKLEIDLGNEVTTRRDMTNSFGYAFPQITRRMGAGTMTVEIPTASSFNWQNYWNNKTKIDGSILIGSVAKNKMTIAWDMVVNASPSPSDTDGILVYEIPFMLTSSSVAAPNAMSILYS